uniref:Uncharacterized protein n=1 Tax=Wuchereria bancrofti TaxID=6293 RepID=A0A1I8EXV3_WUCBA
MIREFHTSTLNIREKSDHFPHEVWPNQRNKKKPEISTDDTTITLTGSDKKLRSRSERLKLSCERLKGFFSQSKNYFDEVELRKKGLTNNEINKRKMSSIGGQTKRSKERIQRGLYYGVNNLDPSAENYITDAEINTRGYVDRNVGDNTDRGRLDYKVCDNGRIYDLKCSNGRSIVLSFSKKNAALVTNWYKNDNSSLS